MKEPKTVYALGCKRRAMSVSDYTQAFAQLKLKDNRYCTILTPVPQGRENSNVSIFLTMSAPAQFIRALLKMISKPLWQYGYDYNAGAAGDLINHFQKGNRKLLSIGHGLHVRLERVPKGNHMFDLVNARHPGLYATLVGGLSRSLLIKLAKSFGMYDPAYSYDQFPIEVPFELCKFGEVEYEAIAPPSEGKNNRPDKHVMAYPEVTFADSLLRENVGKLYWIAERDMLVLSKCDEVFSYFARKCVDAVRQGVKRNYEPNAPVMGVLPVRDSQVSPMMVIQNQPTRALPKHITRVDMRDSLSEKGSSYCLVILGKPIPYSDQIKADFPDIIERINSDVLFADMADSPAVLGNTVSAPYLIHPRLVSDRTCNDARSIIDDITRYDMIKNARENEADENALQTDHQHETGLDESYGGMFSSPEEALRMQQFFRINASDVLKPDVVAELLHGSPAIFVKSDLNNTTGLFIDYASPVRMTYH